MPITILGPEPWFPPVDQADEDGLLAIGGDLSPQRLLLAYRSGIFPWFNTDGAIMWWAPDPRMVLEPKALKVSKSMSKVLASGPFTLTKDTCFDQVVSHCAGVPRTGQSGTWITPHMKRAYAQLHEMGWAASYEVWQEGQLVGGLYGVDLGHVFCGESMFSLVSNASKFAFIHMVREKEQQGYTLIDCQLHTNHLESLGAGEIPRSHFMKVLRATGSV